MEVAMTDDTTIQRRVLDELEWSPLVDATHIGVAVRQGIVELTGHVETYAAKLQAEQVALGVKGVKGVAEEITVRLPNHKMTDDDEIAERAARMLDWDSRVPAGAIKVKVEKGWLTLSGQVASWSQREAAMSDIEKLSGLVGSTNMIAIRPAVVPGNVKARIEDALKRQALLEADAIHVTTQGGKVILDGRVHSWPERSAARAAAWQAPGVTEVVDNLQIAAF
jgi:osmotically-inducible protein OsmY